MALDENGFIGKRKAKIREAFSLFDKDGKNQIIQEEAPTIMRYLGVYPSEKEIIKEIIPAMQEDEPTAMIGYDRFESKMLEIMNTVEYEPSNEETLLQAFRFLDPDNKGFIEPKAMRDLLITKGIPFREKEVQAFMAVAKDPETGNIIYENYVSLLAATASQEM